MEWLEEPLVAIAAEAFEDDAIMEDAWDEEAVVEEA